MLNLWCKRFLSVFLAIIMLTSPVLAQAGYRRNEVESYNYEVEEISFESEELLMSPNFITKTTLAAAATFLIGNGATRVGNTLEWRNNTINPSRSVRFTPTGRANEYEAGTAAGSKIVRITRPSQ